MLSDEEFRQLLNALNRPWAGFRKVRKGVKKRLRRHMESLGCRSVSDYLDHIANDEDVRAACEQCLVVTISRFYRDRRLWAVLEDRILPALAQWFPDGLNVWSAGCANGEEPYSLAICWERVAAATPSLPDMSILATDAQEICLANARQGIYPLSSLKEVPEPLRRQWFQKVPGRKMWQITDHLAKRIHWQQHQLLDTPPNGPFDLILLRNNLLTYYQGLEMEAAFAAIVRRLSPGGLLIVGSHERVPEAVTGLVHDDTCPWIYHRVP